MPVVFGGRREIHSSYEGTPNWFWIDLFSSLSVAMGEENSILYF